MSDLMQKHDLDALLETTVYARPALVPIVPRLAGATPAKPALVAAKAGKGSRLKITWSPAKGENPWLWLIQMRAGGEWTTEIQPGRERSRTVTGYLPEVVAVSAVDRNGNAGIPSTVELRK